MLRRILLTVLLGSAFWIQPILASDPIQRPEQSPSQSQSSQASSEQVRAISAPKNPIPDESASAEVKRFSFIVYGDTRGRRDGDQEQYEHSLIVDSAIATIKRLANSPMPVKFVLQTGDAVVNGRDARQWNKSFVSLINRITTDGGVPYFLAPGNHDVTAAEALESPMRQEGLKNYLGAVANLIPPNGAPRRLDGYPTYAFAYGNAFFIAIDSNIASDDKQFEWIKSQLEGLDRNRFKNVVAFFHHPVFSSGPHGGSTVENPSAVLRVRYMPMFRQHRVGILFAGHEHLFEHWVDHYQDSEGKARRIDQIVTGGGGAPIYSYRGEPDIREYLKKFAGEKVALDHIVKPGMNPGDNPYHYLLVQVDGERVRVEVISVDWGRGYQPYRSNATELRDSN